MSALDPNSREWVPAFAWWPTEIEAFRVCEIKRGKMRYRVWLRRIEKQMMHSGGFIRYRLPQPAITEDTST